MSGLSLNLKITSPEDISEEGLFSTANAKNPASLATKVVANVALKFFLQTLNLLRIHTDRRVQIVAEQLSEGIL